jgi:putative cell wall-binding protein
LRSDSPATKRVKKTYRSMGNSSLIGFLVISLLTGTPLLAIQRAQAATTYTETFDTTTLRDPGTSADWDTSKSLLELPTVAASFYRLSDSRTPGYDELIEGSTGQQFSRSLAIDSAGNPHAVWTDQNASDEVVFYARWNGSTWVDAAGNDPETGECEPLCVYSADAIVSSGGVGEDAFEPSLVLDTNDQPHITWDEFDTGESDYDVKYATWNGSDWVRANGSVGVDDLDGNAGESYAPTIDLINNEPAIAWRDDNGVDVDIYYRQWNGSAWVKADGTAGFDDVSNNATTSEEPSLIITSNNRPMIAWRDNEPGNNEILLKQWNGSAWVSIKGTALLADYNVSNTSTSSTRPSLARMGDDRPAIAWIDPNFGGGNNILYAQWNNTAWVGPDNTTAYLSSAASQVTRDGGANTAGRPSLRMRSDDRPAMTFTLFPTGFSRSVYTEWNGSTWTGGTGIDADSNPATFERSIMHYRSTPSNADIAFDLNSNNDPILSMGVNSILVSRWIEPYQFPGGDWYQTDLSALGSDDVAVHTTGTSPQCYSMASDSLGRPHVTWCEIRGTVYTQMYAYWNGSDWVNVKGTTTDADYAYSFNPVGRPATAGDLVLDANDQPHVAWAQNIGGSTLGIYYIHWDPTANAGAGGWVNAAGSLYTDASAAPAGTIVDSGFTFAPFPTLDLNSSGTPFVAWSEQTTAPRDDIFVSTWNGSAWAKPTTGAAGSDMISQNVGGTSQTASVPDLEVAPNDTVGVTWYQDTPAGISFYIWYSQLKTGSPGTWTKADGVDTDSNPATFESDQLSTGSQTAQLSELGYSSLSRPSLAWVEQSGGIGTTTDIMYSQWSGSVWTKSDGTTVGYENVSDSPDTDFYPRLQIDNDDEPVVAWEQGSHGYLISRHISSGTWTTAHKVDIDSNPATFESSDAALYLPLVNAGVESRLVLLNGETPDVLLQQGGLTPRNTVWHEPYAASVTGTSLTMDSVSDNIAKATLTVVATLNGGTITYEMSNDGSNFFAVTPGVEFTFPTVGSDLRWRATLTGNPTNTMVSPQIDTLSISIPGIETEPDPEVIKRVTSNTPRGLSIEVSRERFGDDEAKVVLLSREDLWVDAFVGTPLSTIGDGPLLLNPTEALDQSVLTEIDRVLPDHSGRIYLLGRERALANKIHDELATAGYTDVVRLGGINRNATAELVAEEVLRLNASQVQSVFLSENERLVDAMTVGSPAAVINDGVANPILLSVRASSTLDAFTANFLRNHAEITSMVIVGGHEALPVALETSIHKVRPNLQLSRLFGATRYGTARAIADTYFTAPNGVVVAGGERQSIAGALTAMATNGLDGLVGALLAGALAADRSQPLLISKPTDLPDEIASYIAQHASTILGAIVVGSEADINAAVVQEIQDLM